jgi:hypothetical protein
VVVLCIGLAVLAVLAFAAHKLMSLARGVDPGDVAVLAVFAAFGAFCALIGWRLLRLRGHPIAAAPSPAAPSKRITASHGCAAAGVLLLILAVLVPEHWCPVVLLFLGLALLAVSHALTPCVERMEQLRRARDSMRQL